MNNHRIHAHMENLFVKSVVTEQVKVKPHELRQGYESTILSRLKTTHEGRCTRNGYVRRGSIRIVKVSEGMLDTNCLNGSVQFVAVFECQSCTPVKGDTVTATVRNFNRFGVMASVGIPDAPANPTDTVTDSSSTVFPVMSIIIPKQSASSAMHSHIDLNNVAVGDNLVTEVINVKYELNDTRISVLGRVIQKVNEGRNVIISQKGAHHQPTLSNANPDFVADDEDPEEAAETSVAAALSDGYDGVEEGEGEGEGEGVEEEEGEGEDGEDEDGDKGERDGTKGEGSDTDGKKERNETK